MSCRNNPSGLCPATPSKIQSRSMEMPAAKRIFTADRRMFPDVIIGRSVISFRNEWIKDSVAETPDHPGCSIFQPLEAGTAGMGFDPFLKRKSIPPMLANITFMATWVRAMRRAYSAGIPTNAKKVTYAVSLTPIP